MGRRALTAATMTVLILMLAVAAFIGWRAISNPVEETPSSDGGGKGRRSCDPGVKKGDILRTREITVSVYNAGTRAGLAAQTQDQLAARRFIRGDVGNAPDRLASIRFVRVFAPTVRDPAARLVAMQFGRHTLVQATDTDLGPGVDVVVGNEFVGLVKAPEQVRATAAGSGC